MIAFRKQAWLGNCEIGRAKGSSKFEKNRNRSYLFLIKRNPTYAVLNLQYGRNHLDIFNRQILFNQCYNFSINANYIFFFVIKSVNHSLK